MWGNDFVISTLQKTYAGGKTFWKSSVLFIGIVYLVEQLVLSCII